MAQITMEPHIAITVEGYERDEKQWRIFYDRRLIGYLSYVEGSEIMPIYRFPYHDIDAIVVACEAERERHGKPSKVGRPSEVLKHIEKALDEQAKKEETDE